MFSLARFLVSFAVVGSVQAAMFRAAFVSPSVLHLPSNRLAGDIRESALLPTPASPSGPGTGRKTPPPLARRPQVRAVFRPAQFLRVAVGVAGITLGSLLPGRTNSGFSHARIVRQPEAAMAANTMGVRVIDGSDGVNLGALGIRQDEFLSQRELVRAKTTQYSEAEEEIMELEEDEVEFKVIHDLQVMWAGLASVGGIYVLYKGGVLWEKWIQEQERKDKEEEIELTGQFIDPRAVRKEEDDGDTDGKQERKKKGDNGGGNPTSGIEGGGDGTPPTTDDLPPGGIDALEKLFGNS